MARVPYLDASDLAPDDQDLLKRPINLFRALVHSPGAARGWSTIGNYIRHGSKLDPRLREMAILQVGYVARAPYEWSHHVKIGHDFGVSDDDIRALIAETEGRDSSLDPFDKIVLKAAREMASDLAISAATFAALRAKLDTELLTDLVLTIAFYCAVVRVLATLQIDVEPDYQPYLEQFPLPKA
jgi:alkylhydroperoxidase family enzyme